jgi:receptor expression-enhancing protein 5/6
MFAYLRWKRANVGSGAQIVFRSLLQPVFAKYFSAGSTADNLKAQSDKAQ